MSFVPVPAIERKSLQLLLLQGHFESAVGTCNLPELLVSQGYRVIVPEADASTGQALFITEQAIHQAAEQTAQALRTRKTEPVLIVAHSWDCLIALHLGLLTPSLLSGLVLIDPMPAHTLPWPAVASLWEKTPFPKMVVATTHEQGWLPQLLQEHAARLDSGSELFVFAHEGENEWAARLSEVIHAFHELRCR